MQNFKIVIQYDGTRYNGWQKQKSTDNTIQGKLEAILLKMTGNPVEVNGSGRTDAGVHAVGQVANFHLSLEDICVFAPYLPRDCQKIPEDMQEQLTTDLENYFNQYLPADIAVLSVELVHPRFHSRLSAVSKIYCYRLMTENGKNVFERQYISTIPETLDMEAVRQAAAYLIGTHDFKSFCSNKHMKKSTVRTVTEIQITTKGKEIQFLYKGNGFLYNMVRILTGTLVEVGLGKRKPEEIPQILEAKNRAAAGMLMPARGLSLIEVNY
jgi:tRNA pseudouridine38-40 synthase